MHSAFLATAAASTKTPTASNLTSKPSPAEKPGTHQRSKHTKEGTSQKETSDNENSHQDDDGFSEFHRDSRNKDRTWDKYMAEVALGIKGYHGLISTLRSSYRARDTIHTLVTDTNIPKLHISTACFNLCSVDDIQSMYKDISLSYGHAAAESQLSSGEIYRSLLNTNTFISITHMFPDLTNRSTPSGWVCVTGQQGSGLPSLLQYITNQWGAHNKLYHNRFDFVYHIKLNLLNINDFYASIPKCHDSYDMDTYKIAWLIFKSYDRDSEITLDLIYSSLIDYAMTILLLLDGFDKIHVKYANNENKTKQIIDKLLLFPNGILTSRSGYIPVSWTISNTKFISQYVLIGLTKQNVIQYIKYFYNHLIDNNSDDTTEQNDILYNRNQLIKEINTNPDVLTLSQTPVNLFALCLVWNSKIINDIFPIITLSKSILYVKLILFLALRYCVNVRHLNIIDNTFTFAEICSMCDRELMLLGKIAYEGYVNNQFQVIGIRVILKFISSYENQTLLYNIIKHWGIIKCDIWKKQYEDEVIDMDANTNNDYISFVHLSYQEFFIAYYILRIMDQVHKSDSDNDSRLRSRSRSASATLSVDLKSTDGKNSLLSTLSLDQITAPTRTTSTLQEMSRLILIDLKSQKNQTIRVFVSGLVSLPIIGYCDNAEYFWDACIDVMIPSALPFVGLHPQNSILQTHMNILREALLTNEAFHQYSNRLVTNANNDKDSVAATSDIYKFAMHGSGLSPRITVYGNRVKSILQWHNICLLKQMQPIFDYKTFNNQLNISIATFISQFPSWNQLLSATLSKSRATDPEARINCAEIIGKIGCKEPQLLLILHTLLQDIYWDVRRAAAEAIGKIKANDAETLRILRSLLHDIYAVRIAAAEALGHIGAADEISLLSLQDALQDRDWVVRSAALDALGRINAHDEETVSKILLLINDDSEYVRRSAICALKELNCDSHEHIEAVRSKIYDSSKRVRVEASKTLVKFKQHDNNCIKILKQDEGNLVLAMTAVTAKDVKSFGALRNACLKDSDKDMRIAATEALKRIGNNDQSILNGLYQELKTKDHHVRAAVAETLGRMECYDKLSLKALCAAAKDRNFEVALSAAHAIKHLSTHLDSPTIIVLLNMINALDIDHNRSLELSYEIHVAMLRIPPLLYAVLFSLYPEYLSNTVLHQFFVTSVWLHSSTILLDIHSQMMKIDETEVSMTGSSDTLLDFMNSVKVAEMDFISSVGEQDIALRDLLVTLRQPVQVPRNPIKFGTAGRFCS